MRITMENNQEINDIKTIDGIMNDLDKFPDDSIVMQLNEDIMTNNIYSQIKKRLDPEETTTDESYFEFFEIRYNYLKNKYKDTDSKLQVEAKSSFDSVLTHIDSLISEEFGFNIVYDDLLLFEDHINYTKALYYFFIIDYFDNLSDFAYNYILENTNSILKGIGDEKEKSTYKNNLSYNLIKEIIDNKYTPIIFLASNIIKQINKNENEIIEETIHNDVDEINNYYINQIFVANKNVDYITYQNKFNHIFSESIQDNPVVLNDIKSRLINYFK